MESERKVAIVTGASQGIGAALVTAYRDRGYRVVATARSMAPSTDDDVATVAGDITDQGVAERVVSTAMARFRPERSRCGQRHEHSNADREAPDADGRRGLSSVSVASGSCRESPVYSQLFDPARQCRHLGRLDGAERSGDGGADQ